MSDDKVRSLQFPGSGCDPIEHEVPDNATMRTMREVAKLTKLPAPREIPGLKPAVTGWIVSTRFNSHEVYRNREMMRQRIRELCALVQPARLHRFKDGDKIRVTRFQMGAPDVLIAEYTCIEKVWYRSWSTFLATRYAKRADLLRDGEIV